MNYNLFSLSHKSRSFSYRFPGVHPHSPPHRSPSFPLSTSSWLKPKAHARHDQRVVLLASSAKLATAQTRSSAATSARSRIARASGIAVLYESRPPYVPQSPDLPHSRIQLFVSARRRSERPLASLVNTMRMPFSNKLQMYGFM